MNDAIHAYNAAQEPIRREICEKLAEEIAAALPEAESKVWHGAPVWFLAGNPVAGYWNRKNHVQLLFWSGQSFDEPDLHAEGSFKAAEARYSDVSEIDETNLRRWLEKCRKIQWDYKNIVKNKGVLNRLP